MACLLYNTGKCLQLLLFNRPNFGVHFSTSPLASRNPDPAPVVSGDRLYVLGLCFHSVKPMLSLSQNIVFTICLAAIRNLLDGNP